MATLKDAEKARSDSSERLRELGAHAVSVEEGEEPAEADEAPTKKAAATKKTSPTKKPSFVVVAYFDDEPPLSMPDMLEVRTGNSTRAVPLRAKRSAKFQIESAGDDTTARPE